MALAQPPIPNLSHCVSTLSLHTPEPQMNGKPLQCVPSRYSSDWLLIAQPSIIPPMCPRNNAEPDPNWKFQELPPADLIQSESPETALIAQEEFSRAEWFWRRRPKILSASLTFLLSYLTVVVCLFYYVPETISFLLLWIVVGASCAVFDSLRLNRWRKEYESSVQRMITHLSEGK